MLKEWWNKLTGKQEAVEHEAEREQMSPAERQFDSERVEDHAADEVAEEHLGGFSPENLEEDDKPPSL
jgi:hypothetical protein